jgi:beta-lactamase superfamily II metal-dependent hydrolase
LARPAQGRSVLFWALRFGSVPSPPLRPQNKTESTALNGIYRKDVTPAIKQLDYVVITHPHRDHLDDIFNFYLLAPKVLKGPGYFSREEILAGNKNDDSKIIEEYFRIHNQYMEPVPSGSTSDVTASEHWGGVRISFFATKSCDRKNLNNHSIVSIFRYADFKIMIPGDNETESWKLLIKDNQFLDEARNIDVLVAPHHGRRSAYCQELFDAIGKPYLTVISDGPECDTSATGNYGGQSRGWRVYYPDGTNEDRLCV